MKLENFEFTLNSPFAKSIPTLEKGKYFFEIIHQDYEIFLNIKKLFITFNSSHLKNEDITNILGIKSISERYGPFKYIGGGVDNSEQYTHSFFLEVKENISNLDINLRTFINNRVIKINSFRIIKDKLDFNFALPDLRDVDNILFLENKDLPRINNKNINELDKTIIFFNSMNNISVLEFNVKPKQILNPNSFNTSEIFNYEKIMKLIELFSKAKILNIISASDNKLISQIKENKSLKNNFYDYLEYIKKPLEPSKFVSIEKLVKNIDLKGKKKCIVKLRLINTLNNFFDKSALVAIKIFSKNEEMLMPLETFAINPKIGAYKYISSYPLGSNEVDEIEINLPESNIDRVELSFFMWGANKVDSYLEISTFEVEYPHIQDLNTQMSIEELFIHNMNEEDKVIFIYTTAPYIGHETLELRPNRLTKEYIKLGYKVIFFAFSRIPEELKAPEEYSGNLLQCYKDDLHSCISLISNKKLKEKIFICSSFPDIFALTAISKLKFFNDWKTVYEIRDDMEEFNRVGYSKWYTSELEVNVARIVDKIVTVSPRLAQKIKVAADRYKNAEWKSKVKVIQNAAPDILIGKSEYLRTINFSELKTQSMVVGYIGHLTPAWFDWPLILKTAKKFPNIKFEIIGHGMPNSLELPVNVEYLGPKNHDEFLQISEKWKVGLIPFIASPLTYGVDPNKIYEYLSANLLVLTADMGSVKECPATYVYNNNDEFSDKFIEAINAKNDQNTLSEIKKYIEKSRWSNRAKSMIDFINEEI